ncbi:MAG: helix-turn-helix transcriptional regulator [Deltaproteobacteria bacterium]|nr:helix-turn-helix transcriptional regulator [Deltaproteobacteria bacterium]
METSPGKVIRSLRQALDMTQTEFARAAGWSTSTISSWERGTTRPSRLAFKTILAFAEERGVRWQPKADGGSTAADAPATLPTLRLGSRVPAPPLVARGTGRAESFGSRRWTDVAASVGEMIDLDAEPEDAAAVVAARAAAFDARIATYESARPDWLLDARLRLEIGTDARWLRRTAALGALAVALAVGVGAGMLWRSTRSAAPRLDAQPASAAASTTGAAAAPAPAPVDELALAAAAAPALGPAPYAAPPEPAAASEQPAPPVVRPMPAPMHARLEAIVALDGTRRATFRVGDRSLALAEGDEIGGRAVALIGDDEVTLVGGGIASRVQLGFDAPLE